MFSLYVNLSINWPGTVGSWQAIQRENLEEAEIQESWLSTLAFDSKVTFF
jgi:hypothetical protein